MFKNVELTVLQFALKLGYKKQVLETWMLLLSMYVCHIPTAVCGSFVELLEFGTKWYGTAYSSYLCQTLIVDMYKNDKQ